MRLDPAEIAELPFPAGLFDRSGSLVAATPEWRGPLPGSVSFYTGAGHLVVGTTTPAAPELEALMSELLHAIRQALPAVAAGRMTVPIDSAIPLKQVNDAFERIRKRNVRGKLVLDAQG